MAHQWWPRVGRKLAHLVTAVAMDRVQLNEVEDIDLMGRQLEQEPQGCLMLLRVAMEQRHRLHEARLRQ